MIVEMKIEILIGGDILVNCKLTSQFEFVLGHTKEFKFNQNLDLNLYRDIPVNLSFLISTS